MLGRTRTIAGFTRFGHLITSGGKFYHQQRAVSFAYRTRASTMDKVYLRNDTDSEEVHISFRYANECLKVNRDFNFCRKMNEKIEDALNRMRGNIEKEFNKKMKKGKKKSSAQVQDTIPEEVAIQEVRTYVDNTLKVTL